MKITPFFMVLCLGLLVSVPMTVYYLVRHNHDAKSVTGILALIFSVVFALILLAERLLVRWNIIPFASLCKLEGIAIAALVGGYILMVLQNT